MAQAVQLTLEAQRPAFGNGRKTPAAAFFVPIGRHEAGAQTLFKKSVPPLK
jgi:hypothetical protein